MKRPDWIQTYTGKEFRFDDMAANDVCIADIAHALSNVCRFSGHSPYHYSVAQHSVLVSRLCSRENALIGLLHDATEAYIGDMVTPLKQLLPDYSKYEDHIWEIILHGILARNPANYGHIVYKKIPQAVHEADLVALAIEAKNVMRANLNDWGLEDPGDKFAHLVVKMSPEEAEKLFLAEYKSLTSGRHSAHYGNSYRRLCEEAGTVFPRSPEIIDMEKMFYADAIAPSPEAIAFERAFKKPHLKTLLNACRRGDVTGVKMTTEDAGGCEKEAEIPVKNILQEAEAAVTGERAASYGHPMEDFTRTAKMWSAILGAEVRPDQIPICMVALKLSRQCHAAKRDNWVDIAGYAQTGYMVNQKQGKME